MGLQKEYVRYLSHRVVDELIKREMIEIPVQSPLRDQVLAVMDQELSVEDRINEEARNLLQQYAEHMRQNGVSYHEIFKMVKNRLVKEKKVIL